jgi:hypothetical protein
MLLHVLALTVDHLQRAYKFSFADNGIRVLHIAEFQKNRDCVTWLLGIGAHHNNATVQWTLTNYLGLQHNMGCPNKSARFKVRAIVVLCASRVVGDICRILSSKINCSVCTLY